MILTIKRDPADSIINLYNQPVLLHDILIVGTLRFVVPPVTDDSQVTAKVDLDPGLPPDIITLCKTRPLHVKRLRNGLHQFTKDWYRYRFRLAAPPDDGIQLEYAGEEVSYGTE